MKEALQAYRSVLILAEQMLDEAQVNLTRARVADHAAHYANTELLGAEKGAADVLAALAKAQAAAIKLAEESAAIKDVAVAAFAKQRAAANV